MFVHLHCHTEYSLLEGATRVKDLLSYAEKYDMPAVALTDNGAMYGALDFYVNAKSKGINPLVGCEMFVTDTIQEKKRGWNRLILLAKSLEGYQNLITLVTISHLDGFYYKPRIDLENIKKHCKDVIAISPGNLGPIADYLKSNRDEEALSAAQEYQAVFGDDFYLGVCRLDESFEDMIVTGTLDIKEKTGIPIVATNNVYYNEEDDASMRDILMCIQTGKALGDTTRIQYQSKEMYFKSPDQMKELFKDLPEAIENTVKIAEKCKLEIDTDQVRLPRVDCPDGLNSEEYLEKLVWEGMKVRYSPITDELKERVRFELDIINKMHYANYFLIIYNFLEAARKKDIPIGPGRGSAAGSIVAYAMDITKIDPIKYNLLFERFLNPERVSMPDIDIDFCIRRRSEVIDAIIEEYGEDKVCQIITFGTMAARGVIRDVGRVLNVPLEEVDKIAKLIPSAPGQYTSIPEALEQVPDLKKLYGATEEHKRLIDTAARLEGHSRHTSTHAAGVVISRDPLSTIVPLTQNDGQVTTQFEMQDIDRVGLLKMDILGLRNLTVLKDCVGLIKQYKGEDLDPDELPLDNEATYDLLCSGNTVGVFQLESKGMRTLIKDLKPRVFEDIIALLALYRPGPLGSGMVQDFISNKSGKTEVKYDLDVLEPILNETYGLILYQEQVMQIAAVIGGFSLGQADMLRRAMGKKKKDVMDKMKDDFLQGAKDQDFPAAKSERIFELCYKFAEYGFNKSHSAAYAFISYQTAYFKANYAVEYMAALLSSILGVSDKVSLYISECEAIGIHVLPPDVNHSRKDFSIEESNIRFGLGAIKNVGIGAIESIIEHREKDGPFKNIADFCKRVDLKQVNKRVLESLIKAGAFDSTKDERAALLAVYERTLECAQIYAKEKTNGQTNLFSQIDAGESVLFPDPAEADYIEHTEQEKLKLEKELLGLYITGHPLECYIDKLAKLEMTIEKINPEEDHNREVLLGGMLTECRRMVTKTQKNMCIGNIEDRTGTIAILLFEDDNFERLAEMFEDDAIVYAKGKLRVRDGEASLFCESLERIDTAHGNKRVYIDINNIEENDIFEKLKDISLHNRGSMPLYFRLGDTTVEAHRKYWVKEDELCLAQIQSVVGSGHVTVM